MGSSSKIWLKRYANGVMYQHGPEAKVRFAPYRVLVTPAGVAPAAATAKQRIFVESLVISHAALVGDIGTEITVTGKVDNETMTLASYIKTTALVSAGSQEYSVGVILDKETLITVTAANITSVRVSIKYANLLDDS